MLLGYLRGDHQQQEQFAPGILDGGDHQQQEQFASGRLDGGDHQQQEQFAPGILDGELLIGFVWQELFVQAP